MSAPGRLASGVRGLAPPVTEQADDVERIWAVFLWIGFGVLALVVGLVGYIMLRFRRRSDELPPQKHYNIPMEVTYTVIPFLVVMALFGITYASVVDVDDVDDDADLTVEVTAFQWQWQFAYPESGVTILGGAEGEHPELVLPTSSKVVFELESLDVIHSFWITAFRFKRDIIPGTPGRFQVDITNDPGEYPNAGVCAEYCGLDHATMRFSVRLLEPDDFARWLDEQATTSAGPSTPAPTSRSTPVSTVSGGDR